MKSTVLDFRKSPKERSISNAGDFIFGIAL